MKQEHRILIIDDNEAIHDDLRKILSPAPTLDDEMKDEEELLFGAKASEARRFSLDSAYQGQEGLRRVEAGKAAGCPYALAFVDVRMPPGWDGIETTTHLWRCDPDLQVVICTAYTDYSWREIVEKLGESHNFVILKKPFDNIEVVQLAHALSSKRDWIEQATTRLREVEAEVAQRKQAQQELLQALDAAEEANRCKRDFLATMSHELKTPLNAILGYSEMLVEDAQQVGGGQIVKGLEKIQTAGRHLLEVINDILDMSRIESGKMPIRSRRISVGALARAVMAVAEPLALKRGNTLSLEMKGEHLWVEADDTRFQQCLLNLVGNACKFTNGGKVVLEVEQPASGEWIYFRVRDTGIGIAGDQMEKLFQAFSQVDSAASRKFGGSGLGLAISQRLCNMMGGEITVESELGKGSVFTIRIPAAESNPSGRASGPGSGQLAKETELLNARA